MDKLIIRGGNRLSGRIPISGAKNAALLAAAILANSDPALAERLDAWRAAQTDAVADEPA